MRIWSLAGTVACMMLSGCANLDSIWHTDQLGPNARLVSADAKQRFVITVEEPRRPNAASSGPQEAARPPRQIVCTDKSPDVFSAYAAALSGSFGVDAATRQIEATFSGSSSEQAATIHRAMMIDAQAAQLSRICELYAAGALTPAEAATQYRRFLNTMVVLTAIDGLTSRSPLQQVALNTSANASTGTALKAALDQQAEMNAKLDKARTDVREQEARVTGAEEDLKKLQAAQAAATDDKKADAASATSNAETALKNARTELATRQSKLTDAENAVKVADRAVQAARSTTQAQASGATAVAQQNQPVSDASAIANAHAEVAKTIKNIVTATLEQSFMQESCLMQMINGGYRPPNEIALCETILREALSRAQTGQRLDHEYRMEALRRGVLVSTGERGVSPPAAAMAPNNQLFQQFQRPLELQRNN